MKKGNQFNEVLQSLAALLTVSAIVSPLFLGGMPQQSQQLHRYEAIGIATKLYSFDFDDAMPLAHSRSSVTRQWRWNSFTAVPAGWSSPSRHLNPRKAEDSMVVYNSIQVYANNLKIYEEPNFPETVVIGQGSLAVYAPARMNVTYNGLLHAWPSGSVAVPERLTMFWQSFHENRVGVQVSNPALNCSDPNLPCRFHPITGAQGTGQTNAWGWFGASDPQKSTVWHYGHSMLFLSVNGTVDMRPVELPTTPETLLDTDNVPWANFNAGQPGGSPFAMWSCVSPGSNVGWPTFFRPDKTFTGTDHCP